MRYLLGDKGYYADSLRDAGATHVISGRCNRKCAVRYDKQRYRGRHLIENAFWLQMNPSLRIDTL
ncbi:hypothetical protein KRR38_32760 [Novosphingobium sp. G106]|uniref:hypothetical protein n=1 Tax=Novosphingobium sp. G106 TaxID=2849500 RepID=UPI001C2D2B07|nr:hypothetical protein [Novosphingobium sp. G106]MBV1692304.1 hypothetical protein [Novosphingobium sp. G106]